MSNNHYLTTKEVCAELEITAPTLYAYVSRGLIRSESVVVRRGHAVMQERMSNDSRSGRSSDVTQRNSQSLRRMLFTGERRF